MSEKTLTTAQRIRAARHEAGWTQNQLAEASGIAQPNIARYERGNSNPTSETVDRLFTALRNAGATIILDSVDGVLGIQGRSGGKLGAVGNLMVVPKPKEWLVDGLLARGFVTLLAGQEGSGKSTVAQTIVTAGARGESETFGFRMPGTPLRSLIIDAENVLMIDEDNVDGSLVQERLQRFGLTDETEANVTVLGASGFDLDKDFDVLDGVLTDALTLGVAYDVVVFDSFRSLWVSGSENTAEAGRVLARINRLAFKHHVGIIVLHHTNKAGAAYSGHTSIGSTVAAVWTFSRLVHKNRETGVKEQHPTMRFLSPYKVRIAAECTSRIVSVGALGITSSLTAADYDGFVPDDEIDDEEE